MTKTYRIRVPAFARKLFRVGRYDITIDDYGIRKGEEMPVAWTSIDGLREARGRRWLDLLSGGVTAMSINYRLAGVAELVDEIVRHISFHDVPERRLAHRHPVLHIAVVVPLIALSIGVPAVLWMHRHDPLLFAFPLLGLGLAAHLLTTLFALEIDETGMTLVRLFRREHIAFDEISAVRLFLERGPKQTYQLEVSLTLRGARQQNVSVPGNTPLAIYHAISAPLSASNSRSTER